MIGPWDSKPPDEIPGNSERVRGCEDE